MPVLKYFLGVGAALLALIFLVDAMIPKSTEVVEHRDIDRSVIRITASPTVSAAAVTIDANARMPDPKDVVRPETLPVAAAAAPASSQAADARAEAPPAAEKPVRQAESRQSSKRRRVVQRQPAYEPRERWAYSQQAPQPGGFFSFGFPRW